MTNTAKNINSNSESIVRKPAFRRFFAVLFALVFACSSIFFASCKKNDETGETFTCTFSVECSTILSNMDDFNKDKLEVLPADGILIAPCEVTVSSGETVYDVLVRETKARKMHMESKYTPVYDSAYIMGINNIYEFDCGSLSGWMYSVNGVYPNYGCSAYKLEPGDKIEWRYTCDLGTDIGGSFITAPESTQPGD